MIDILNTLNVYGPLIQGTSTVVLVIITFYYTYQTKRNVDILQQSNQENTRPRISIYLEQREDSFNLLDLVILNSGGAARNISFVLDGDIENTFGNTNLSQINIIKNGIPTLSPKKQMIIPLMLLIGRLEKLKSQKVTIHSEYSDVPLLHVYKDDHILTFDSLIEHQIGSSPIVQLLKNTKDIVRELHNISRR